MAADTLTTVANSTYAGAFGNCFQANIHFTGEAWKFVYYPGNGTTTPACKVAYGDPDSGVFSAAHDVPNASQTTNRGYKICSTWNPVLYKHVYLWVSNYGKGFIKDDANFTASTATDAIPGLAGTSTGFGTHDLLYGCCIYDKFGRIWQHDTASTQTRIRVKRSTSSLDNENWDGYSDIVTGLGGTAAATLVPFDHVADSADIGCIYSNGSSLYFKYYTDSTSTWEATETISSAGLNSYLKWAAVSTVAGEVVVFWRDVTTTTTIKCRIRSAAGSWGSVFDAATDLSATYNTMCATNNLGAESQVFFYYHDGTDLVMNSVTNGSLGSKFVMSAAPGTLKTVQIQSPRQSINKFGLMYHEDSTGDIKLATHSSTPVERGTSGKLVSSLGYLGYGTFSFAKQISDYGDLSFVTWLGYDGKSYANVYNNVTSTWLYSSTAMSPVGYFDAHNVSACTISSDGYVYLAMAGRLTITTNHIIVKKSDYPLGHGSFTLSAFTDISPSSTGITTGRGYKYLCVDSNGILHLGTVHQNTLILRNYNGSTWTTYAAGNVADFETLGSTNYLYVEGMILGNETPGQQTLNIALSYWDATHGNGNGAYRHFFMRVTMQGDRSYLAADIGGTSITLPLDETYTTGNALYFDGSVETTKLRAHWNGFDMLEDNTPCIVSIIYTTAMVFDHIRATTWNGSAWVDVNTGATWTLAGTVVGNRSSMVTYHDSVTERITTLYSTADGNSIAQLYQTTSDDAGATWSALSARTANLYHTLNPSVDAAVLCTLLDRITTSEVRMLPRTLVVNKIRKYLQHINRASTY